MQILKPPQRSQEETPTEVAGRISRWKFGIKEWIGRILNRLGVPGAIQDAVIDDGFTGQHVSIQVGTLFTRISVNGRDYYFRRMSGRFDGTGTGCRQPTRLLQVGWCSRINAFSRSVA